MRESVLTGLPVQIDSNRTNLETIVSAAFTQFAPELDARRIYPANVLVLSGIERDGFQSGGNSRELIIGENIKLGHGGKLTVRRPQATGGALSLGGLLERAVTTGAILCIERLTLTHDALGVDITVLGTKAGRIYREKGTAEQQDNQAITRHSFLSKRNGRYLSPFQSTFKIKYFHDGINLANQFDGKWVFIVDKQ